MNILRIIYDWADPEVFSGGLAPGPYELSIAQAKLGHKIYVLCGNLNGKNLMKGRFSYTLENGNITVYNLPRALNGVGPFFTSSLFVLPYYFFLRLTKKIDLVHNHQQMGVWFLLYKKIFGTLDKIPVIHTNHGAIKARHEALINSKTSLPFLTKYVEYPIHQLNDSLSMQVANSVIAVSTNLKDELVHYYGNDEKITTIENGVNLEKLTKDGPKMDFGFSSTDIILGNLGRLSERKNIHIAIESLRYLDPKYKLVLAGEWDKSYKENVIDPLLQVRDRSGILLSDRVKYVGSVPYWKNQEFFRSLNIFIIPSKHEGLPKVVLEAAACGNKVVASGFSLEHTMPNVHILKGELVADKVAEVIEEVQKGNDYYDLTHEILIMNYSWDAKAKEMDKVYIKWERTSTEG